MDKLKFGTDEPTIKANMRNWLMENGFETDVEYRTKDGPIDIYLPNRRVIIEVKKRGRLYNGINKKGTGGNREESAYEQLERYYKAESKRERLNLEENINDLPWLGVITDGEKWWIWSISNGVFTPTEYQNTIFDDMNEHHIIEMFDRTVGLQWAPTNLSDLLYNDLNELKALYEKKKALTSTQTKEDLWYQQLEISGNAPPDTDKDELFVLHSFLIAVCTCITNSIAPVLSNEKQLGFTEWIRAGGDSEWYNAINEKIKQYNWKQRPGDILRKLYMDLIDYRHRKIYGEYYTPDWLAEKLCREVIDDKFITLMIKRYYDAKTERILDPACGSGTFLFHVIRRVMDSKPVSENEMDPGDITEMLAKSVCGIDIHPVAVYMTKTNILRALPRVPHRPLRVWQGDSLQTERDTSNKKLFEGENAIVIYSGKGRRITLPKTFLLENNIMDRITRLVNTADDGKPFPSGIEHGLNAEEIDILKETHRTLVEICKQEGNSVWAWYIINQSGPFILLHERVGRIVSNPPWVAMNKIQVKSRKKEIIESAKKQKLWVGGKVATSFDIASLFVDKCFGLYLDSAGISGWVLPWSALKGSSWVGYHEKYDKHTKKIWDLGHLPFPKQAQACTNIISKVVESSHKQKLLKQPRVKIEHNEPWSIVESKTTWVKFAKEYPKEPSEYTLGTKVESRQGATIVPSCLVRIKGSHETDGEIKFTTMLSTHLPWKELGAFSGRVPKHYVQTVLFGEDMFPYRISDTPNKVIAPLNEDGTGFDDSITNQYWKDADDQYKGHRGMGSNTPRTLLRQIDFSGKLSKQFSRENKYIVMYNSSGTWLCAAYGDSKSLIEHTLYAINIKTKNEALYLTAMLNAETLQTAYQGSKKADKHFMNHFWFAVPIPRYDKNNKHHTKLAQLAKHAEQVAAMVQNLTRKSIRKALIQDGVSGKIDVVVQEILPNHTETLTKQKALSRL